MSIFWNIWIIGLTLICLALVLWVLLSNRKVAVSDQDEEENRTTGHVYDGIEEYDNPLPRWWFNLFIGTLVFSAIYLVLYPGLGSFPGLLGWSSAGELKQSQAEAQETYDETYAVYASTPVEELANNPGAIKMGVRLFANNCAVCHGADAGGMFGFPNLTDDAWLWGGKPEQIKHSIAQGRQGNMPPWGDILGEQKVQQVSHFVRSLSGLEHDTALAGPGAQVFQQSCAACHGADGTGMHQVGAPNLTDDAWLYGSDLASIAQTVRKGRANKMPAQKDLLREEKIHVLTAYLLYLSDDGGSEGQQ